jgi:hypothetical protein
MTLPRVCFRRVGYRNFWPTTSNRPNSQPRQHRLTGFAFAHYSASRDLRTFSTRARVIRDASKLVIVDALGDGRLRRIDDEPHTADLIGPSGNS